MSLDNTLAIAAVANGNYVLLAVGLALSIPLIIFGSKLIMMIMDKLPIVTYAGAALIAWTASEKMVRDQWLGEEFVHFMPEWLLPALITVGVIAVGV